MNTGFSSESTGTTKDVIEQGSHSLSGFKSLIIIPVYNQPERLLEVVQRTLVVHSNLLVVDDGSDPPVAEVLAESGVTIVRHETNRGKAGAILTAAQYARNNGYSHVLTIDADGQHNPEEIPLLLAEGEKDHACIVIGLRDMADSNAPMGSRFGRSFGNFWVRMQTGINVGDIQSGFRLYPVGVLQAIKTRFGGYAFEVEIIVRASWAGVPLRKADVSVHYDPPDKRVSHFRVFRDNSQLTILNTILTMRSMLPWPHRQYEPETGKLLPVTLRRFAKWMTKALHDGDKPWRIATAAFLGIVIGTLPLIALHMLVVMAVARWLRLNMVMALGTSHLCAPPLIPLISIEVGHCLRSGTWLTFNKVSDAFHGGVGQIGHLGLSTFFDWFLGSLLVGPVFGFAVAALVYIFSILARRIVVAR